MQRSDITSRGERERMVRVLVKESAKDGILKDYYKNKPLLRLTRAT